MNMHIVRRHDQLPLMPDIDADRHIDSGYLSQPAIKKRKLLMEKKVEEVTRWDHVASRAKNVLMPNAAGLSLVITYASKSY